MRKTIEDAIPALQAMKETTQSAISVLEDIHGNMNRFEDLSAAVDDIEAKHKSVAAALAETSAALEGKKSLLGKAREEAISQHNLEMYSKTESLKSLTAQISKAQAQLDELRELTATARIEHNSVLESMSSLRKRLG